MRVGRHSVRMLQPLVRKECTGMQRVPHPPTPFLDTLTYHNGMLLRNSLQVADLRVRKDREQLPPHFRGDIAVSRHAVRRREG